MSRFFALILLLVPFYAQSSLLDRIQVQDILEKKVEQFLERNNFDAKAAVSLSFRSYTGLPGLTNAEVESSEPSRLDLKDIARININIYGSANDLPENLKSSLFDILPVNKGLITIKYQKTWVANENSPITNKDLVSVSESFSDQLKQIFWLGAFGSLLLLISCLFLISRSNIKAFKNVAEQMTSVLSNTGLKQASYNTEKKSDNYSSVAASSGPGLRHLEEYDIKTLASLFSDCYWTHNDNYASWLWQNVSFMQKNQLLKELDYLKTYSEYFIKQQAQSLNYHDHPYYLGQNVFLHLSQEDLQLELNKNKSIWSLVSPMRQVKLQLPIFDKIKLVENNDKISDYASKKKSSARSFEKSIFTTYINVDEELAVFNNPDLVPLKWQKNITSLVWLSLKPQDYIESVLSNYDAKSLASAWLAPIEVLTKLEASLPAKKLAMLKSYQTKYVASKDSPVYLELCQSGTLENAA